MTPSGAAILDFGGEFGPNGVEKTMRNDGPDLSANNLRSNKVTPYTKVGNVSSDDHGGGPNIETMGGDPTPGYKGTKVYGQGDSTSDTN